MTGYNPNDNLSMAGKGKFCKKVNEIILRIKELGAFKTPNKISMEKK